MNSDTPCSSRNPGFAGAPLPLLLASVLFGCGGSNGVAVVDASPDSPVRAVEDAATDSGADGRNAGGADASSDATADAPTEGGGLVNATCLALCTTAAPMLCTFARNGVTEATGTYSISALTATGCSGTAAVSGSNEKVALALDCALGQICIYEGAKKECYPGQFDPKAFVYEIPADKKRNSCAVP